MPVKSLQSVTNALTVLEHLAEHQPLGVTALARGTRLQKMAVQRILVTAEQAGWVRRVGEPRGSWELTAVPRRVGEAYSASLRAAARAHLEHLTAVSGETALLFRREGDRLVLIDGVDSPHLIRMTVPTGTEVPMQRSGTLDAFLDDDERATLELAQGTDEPSHRQLDQTRRAGYFVIDGMYPHSTAVGAPLFDTAGRVAGTVLVVGPRERLPRERHGELGRAVAAAAHAISAG